MAGKFKHVGYMQAKFRSVADANAYYMEHNKHMRSITAHGGVYSDWDPDTHLRYVIRQILDEAMTVEPFTSEDKPTQVKP